MSTKPKIFKSSCRLFFTAALALFLSTGNINTIIAATRESAPATLPQQALIVSGTVSEGQNPVANVVVSDGHTCVATDRKGRYTLTCDPSAKYVFISVPSGYQTVGQPGYGSYPDFYKSIETLSAGRPNADFQLHAIGQDTQNFTLFAVGDPQSNEDSHIARYETQTLGDIQGQLESKETYAVAIALGDVVGRGDADSHFKHKRAMGSLGIPFYTTVGNHDKDAFDYTGEQFSRALGPRWYSFNVGDVHFVALDNVDVFDEMKKGAKYHAGFSDVQLAWLRQDLAHVRRDKMIALFYHIPERDHSDHRNHDEVFSLISKFRNAVCFCGHTHYYESYKNARYEIPEYILGAACGYFWRSDCSTDGVPNGYGVFEVRGTEITNAYFKGTGHPRECQMRLYRGSDVYGGERARYCFESGEDTIVANVFFAGMGGDWKVELYEDGVLSGPMEKMAPTPGDLWIRGYHTGICTFPFASSTAPCHHLYKYKLRNPRAKVLVKATDPFGNIYTEEKITRSGDYGDADGSFKRK